MKPKMKLLIVADTLDVNASSGAKGRLAFINSLVQSGYHCTVYHYSRIPVLINGVKKCVEIPEAKASLYYWLAKTQVLLQRVLKTNFNHWIEHKRGFSFTHTYDWKSIQKAIKHENPQDYDAILALSYASSFRSHRAILDLPDWHKKFIAYVHDPYPMHSYPRPYDWVEPGHQFKRNFFVAITRSAQHLIYPSKLLAQWMESYYHDAHGKALVIPHQLPVQSIENTTVPAWVAINKFIILHAGSLMSARNPTYICEAFQELCKENKEFKEQAQLVFIGSDSVFNDTLNTYKNSCKQIVIQPDRLPFKETLAIQGIATVHVILEAVGSISPFLPGKIAHAIHAQKHMLLLGPYYSEARRILGKNYPFYSEINDVDNIKSKLYEMYLQWKSHGMDFKYSDHRLNDYFSPSYLKKQLDTAIDATHHNTTS